MYTYIIIIYIYIYNIYIYIPCIHTPGNSVYAIQNMNITSRDEVQSKQ